LQPITGRHAVRGPRLISFPKSVVVAEEADETLFWFELLVEAELVNTKAVEPLMKECKELLKIFSVSLTTAKRNR
jgi:hypothetical protein